MSEATRRRSPAAAGASGERRAVRVLLVAKGLGPGGMERLLVNQARFGDRSRVTYTAAYLTPRPHSVIGELEELGVECVRLGHGRDLDPRWGIELRRLVSERGIDVVHVHSPMPAAVARPALRSLRPRPRLVYTEHNSWECYSAPTRAANALTYPLDDVQIAVSSAAVASVPRALRGRIAPMTHGIDQDAVREHAPARARMRAELGVDDDTVVVVTVANLRAEKAYDVLLDAARRVVDRNPHVVFLSVGQGPLAAEMEVRRDELGLGDSFRFLGFRDDVADLLAASDVFCLSSRHEGLPLALMEAMTLGLPVVATAVGGLPDHVVDGRTGRLVPPEQPEALADALSELAGDADLRAALASGSAAAAGAFDARAAVARIEALYLGDDAGGRAS